MASNDTGLGAEHALWLLSDPMRMEILRTVAAHEPVSFSDIREPVGRPDGGRFNYHVDELRGHFLSNDENGYRVTQAGREVIRAVLAGIITETASLEADAIDGECVECGGTLRASYDEYARIDCGDCGTTVMWNEFPPAGLTNRDVSAFAHAFDRWTQHRFRLVIDDVCPNCAVEMETDGIERSSGGVEFSSMHRCPNCGYETRIPLFGHAIQHPAVISFYYEPGIDITSMPYWDLHALLESRSEEQIASNPRRVRLALQLDGRELSLEIGEQRAISDIVVSEY